MKTYTTGEIAAFCDVNLRTVIRWIEKGALKGFKLPGRGNNRVRKEDFISFLQDHGMPVPSELHNSIRNHILIVDDELPVAKAIQRSVKGAGYDTSIATNGFQAGIQLLREKPVLMILDLMMPCLDGYQVLNSVRNSDEVFDIKILVISVQDESCLKSAMTYGADAMLQKPFESEQLIKTIESLLEPQRTYRSPDINV